MNKFQSLGLQQSILKAIEDLGFENPTDIQSKTIPILLNEETDLVALAQTGTGKTAAFGFPIIQNIDTEERTTQALILAPTRELCLQITDDLVQYAKYVPKLNIVAVYGGASIMGQSKELKRGAHIIVATPGRLKDMIDRKIANVNDINICVLDEADEMLNMGFYEEITEIIRHTPPERNTWLFSATMFDQVAKIANEFMKKPLEITIGNKNEGPQSVSHEYYVIQPKDRYLALKRLADANPDIFSVVFCRTKKDTQEIADKLIEDGYNAAPLHGDLSQAQRDAVMKSFRGKQLNMLIATDVAARGIDVDDITHVINYQFPDELEVYTHRSGRTGRAGKSGTSMTIVSKGELRKVAVIEKMLKQKFEEKPIPSGIEICEIQLFHLANKIKEVQIDHEINSYLPAIMELFETVSKEELIKKMVSVEFNRFLQYYKNTPDLAVESRSKRGSTKTEYTPSDDQTIRYFINLGSRDGFDWKRLKDFLKAMLEMDRDEVYKVDVKENFSFFNTDPEHKKKVMESFQNFKFEGRRVSVEISKTEKNRKPSSQSYSGKSSAKKDYTKLPKKTKEFDNFSRFRKSSSEKSKPFGSEKRKKRK